MRPGGLGVLGKSVTEHLGLETGASGAIEAVLTATDQTTAITISSGDRHLEWSFFHFDQL